MNPCTIDETIAITGAPRSGTSWLLELLRSVPEYKALREPLHRELAFRKYGFEWRTYLEPGTSSPLHRAYLDLVLTGRAGIPGWHFEASTRIGQLVEHATRNQLIVKFYRLNRMLVWFGQQFATRGTIFIIRHPCAVVSSMMNHGLWSEENLHG